MGKSLITFIVGTLLMVLTFFAKVGAILALFYGILRLLEMFAII